MILLPFQTELGAAVESAAPLVQEHFFQSNGTRRYSGTMTRVWRCNGWQGAVARPFLWFASLSKTLFAETGVNVPFELENIVTAQADGRATMSWIRTFRFPRRIRQFPASMCYDPDREVIVDLLGRGSRLEVELHASVDNGAVVVESGRQRLCIGRWRIAIPRCLRGNAHACEWQASDDTLGICVTISNPLVGEFFGYEGTFSEVSTNDTECDAR